MFFVRRREAEKTEPATKGTKHTIRFFVISESSAANRFFAFFRGFIFLR